MSTTQTIQEISQTKAVAVVNYIAAALGIGTFAGLVNVVVGVLSATWLAVQLWGYFKYELPAKKLRLRQATALANTAESEFKNGG